MFNRLIECREKRQYSETQYFRDSDNDEDDSDDDTNDDYKDNDKDFDDDEDSEKDFNDSRLMMLR